MAKVAVLGSGGFGTSLAVTLYRCGHDVTLWFAFKQELDDMRRYGENKKLLPGISVDSSINLTMDMECVKGTDMVISAVPSFAVREVAQKLKNVVDPGTIVVNVGKGFEDKTDMRLSQVLEEELPKNPIVILSGPSHAEEIARGVPTTLVAASKNRESAEFVQDTLMNTNLRIYVSDDVVGVELGGALKNIIALCAGIADGMGLGDNTKAALMTRGLAEIARLGVAMGADSDTFAGLSGMGDLIVTCTSMHSRNRRAGIYIGQGLSASQAISRVGMTVEGSMAAKSAYRLSKKYNVSMPIVHQLIHVLNEEIEPKEAVMNLMDRPARHENESIWLKDKKSEKTLDKYIMIFFGVCYPCFLQMQKA